MNKTVQYNGMEFDEPEDLTKNNGGSTDYYHFNPLWKTLMDMIEERKLNYSQGNILKVAFTFTDEGNKRHIGTNYRRDLNKIIYFAQRELATLDARGL